jgi:hypothetical protein
VTDALTREELQPERTLEIVESSRELIDRVRDDRPREDERARKAKVTLRKAQARIRRAALSGS